MDIEQSVKNLRHIRLPCLQSPTFSFPLPLRLEAGPADRSVNYISPKFRVNIHIRLKRIVLIDNKTVLPEILKDITFETLIISDTPCPDILLFVTYKSTLTHITVCG
jgi:hypothetical protein